MNKYSRILVLGHRGLVGSALVRRLLDQDYEHVLQWPREEIDLRDPVQVRWAFSVYRPEYVFFAAAKVGGIRAHANDQAGMLIENLQMQNNVILNAEICDVKKLVFLGSSCAYPEHAPIPTTEDQLLAGSLQPANEGYAIAKIAGIKLCQYLRKERGFNAVSAVPCNLFGPGDSANVETSHVIPGMMMRMHHAKVAGESYFPVWGNSEIQREFLYSEDLADALILVMQSYESDEPINTGSGFTLDMKTLAEVLAYVTGYTGELRFTQQDAGTSHKCMDNSKIHALGWEPRTEFSDALRLTHQSFLNGEFR